MDPVSANDSKLPLRVYSAPSSPAHPAKSISGDESESLNSVVNPNELGMRAEQSGDDIRPEAIVRAQSLLNDPNWLNDEALESLADKLISSEEL